MKALKVYIPISILALSLLFLSFQPMTPPIADNSMLLADSVHYPDGIYEGKSRDGYTGEPFWGIVKIKVENGAFATINFKIRDTSFHESVDSMYGIHHYPTFPAYQLQCVKDGNGIKTYPRKLLETQDMGKVDAMSGATWSYNIFKASVKAALPEHQTGILQENDADKFSIKAFPNPYHSGVIIEYHLITKSQVNLSIFNEEGQLVKQLVNEIQALGPHAVRWEDCSPKGIYFYRLQAGDAVLKGPLLGVKQ
jgi:major membrane immunogen (membrane-anchored lipoprotein)